MRQEVHKSPHTLLTEARTLILFKRITQIQWFLTIWTLSVVCLPIARAQNNAAKTPTIYPSTSWASKPWSGDNKPYHEARVQIDNSAARGKLNLDVVATYYKLWLQTPGNPLALFRWAYANDVVVARFRNLPPHPSPADGAFGQCPDPHTYDYERIRYLINWSGNEIVLLSLAKRLLAHDPNDYPIQFNLASRYGGNDSPVEKAASIARAMRLLAQYPHKPEIYSILAGIYCDHWLFQKNAADGQKAIFYYNKYLQLAPADDPWRKQAKYWINQINHRTL